MTAGRPCDPIRISIRGARPRRDMIDSHESGTLWRNGLPGEARLQLDAR